MICDKCNKTIEAPSKVSWICPDCKNDLLSQGTEYDPDLCDSTIRENSTCDNCKKGIMNYRKLERPVFVCDSCGHYHHHIFGNDSGIGEDKVNVSPSFTTEK